MNIFVRVYVACALILMISCAENPVAPSESFGSSPISLAVKPSARGNPGGGGGSLSLNKSAWDTLSIPNPFPLRNEAGRLVFDFPAAPNTINYLYNTHPPANISGTLSASLALSVTGSPIFHNYDVNADACASPANARPFFISNHFDWSGDYSRWWANPTTFVLSTPGPTMTAIPGSIVLNVPITPDQWSSVNGQFGNANAQTLAGFNQAITHVSGLGVTLGGGCFFGHGLYVSGGTATLAITDYHVQ